MGGRLEVCIDSFESAVNAINGGAHQLEVCSSLALGGITPSIGLVRCLRASFPKVPLFVMLRPRGGNFIYTEDEVNVMLEDLRAMKAVEVAGFVFGALEISGSLNLTTCERLIRAAKPSPCTLHRAFDLVKDWQTAIEQAIKLGYKAILSSGRAATAIEGRETLRKMHAVADGRIYVIAGSGVNSKTLPLLMSDTGCSWFHGSASVTIESQIPKVSISMGPLDTDVRRVASEEEVRCMRNQLDAFFGERPLTSLTTDMGDQI